VLSRLTRLAKALLAVAWIRTSYERVTRWTLDVGALNRVTATLYSLLAVVTFNREQYAVMRGRRDYDRNLHRARSTHVELRRNVRRPERGMSLRPRRPVFAKDYDGEPATNVEALRKILRTDLPEVPVIDAAQQGIAIVSAALSEAPDGPIAGSFDAGKPAFLTVNLQVGGGANDKGVVTATITGRCHVPVWSVGSPQSEPLGAVAGPHRLRFAVPALSAANKTFRPTVVVHEPGSDTAVTARNFGASFTMESSDLPGLLRVDYALEG
jgi:hypothetical protein